MKKKLLILILLNSLMISFIACQDKGTPYTEKETEVETKKETEAESKEETEAETKKETEK